MKDSKRTKEDLKKDAEVYRSRYRENMKKKGFTIVSVWVPEKNQESLRNYAAKLRKKYKE